MKILELPAYFIPEQMASTHLQIDRLDVFSKRGYNYVAICPTPTRGITREQRKKLKGININYMYNDKVIIKYFKMYGEGKNVLFRAIRYFLCAFIQYFRGVKEKNIDIVFSNSTPPIQGLMCGLVARRLSKKYKKSVPFIYNLQDIFPDSLVSTGIAKEGSFIWNIGKKVETKTYELADKIIVISDSFRINLLNKGVPDDKIEVVPNWVDIDKVKPIIRSENILIDNSKLCKSDFIVTYAGNFGSAQGTNIIFETARRFENFKDIKFVIFGGGPNFLTEKEKHKSCSNIIINDLLPQNMVSYVYSLGDVSLITCKKGTGFSGMPSKTWSILATKTMPIACFDKESDLGLLINNNNVGEVVEPEDANQLEKIILYYYHNRNVCKSKAENGYKIVKEKYSKKVCVDKYIRIFEHVYKSY